MTKFHLETTAGALASALKLVTPVIRKNHLPILLCVKLEERRITATDLDVTIRAPFAATKMRGALAVDYRSLGVVKLLAEDAPVSIVEIKGGALMTFPGGSYDLLTLPASDFPEFQRDGEWESVHGNGATGLPRALAAVRFAISTEETRYYLNGVCLSKKDGETVVVATDGHRLAWQKAHVPWPDRWDGIIVPRVAVDHLVRLKQCDRIEVLFALETMRPNKEGVSVEKERPIALRVHAAGVVLTTKLIDGVYPDWHRVMPKGLKPAEDVPPETVKLAVPVEGVKQALSRIRAASQGGSHGVTLDTSRGEPLVLTARPHPATLLVEVVPVDRDVQPEANRRTEPITFNAAYLAALLAHVPDPVALFQSDADDGGVPCALVHEEGGHILMPMRGSTVERDLLTRRLEAIAPAPSEAA